MLSFSPRSFLLFACLIAFSGTLVFADEDACSSFLLADADSGTILDSKDPATSRPPASMVKLMLSYSVLNQLALGNVKLDDIVTVSAAASRIGGSQVYLKEGETFSVKDLLQAVLIQSANDGAFALAEHLGGSGDGFVDVMYEDALNLGLTNSEFHSPHGLPPDKDDKPDIASAEDFLILSRALLKRFPQVLNDTKIKELPFRDGEFIMRNHNKLLFKDSSVDGLKTGYYGKAGFNVTVTALRKGVRLIAVLMGCERRIERDRLAQELLEKGFRKFIAKSFSVDELSGGVKAMVPNGEPNQIELKVKDSGSLTILREKVPNLSIVKVPCANLHAPVKDMTPCGNVNIKEGEEVVASFPLFTVGEVKEVGIVGKLLYWWNNR